jgi:hypothetical protein
MDIDDVATSQTILELALLDPEPLKALRACRSLQRTITDEVGDRVFDARAQGASWGDVGFALGITKQAAQQRFGD